MEEGTLAIENERLKTTIMILNQKMKVQEDNDELNDKQRSQLHARDSQIRIMQNQNDSHAVQANEHRDTIKELNSEVASLESKLNAMRETASRLKNELENS